MKVNRGKEEKFMKTRIRLISVFVCISIMFLIAIVPNYSAEKEKLQLSEPFVGAIGTASAVGGFYLIGGGISSIVNKYVEGLTLSPQVTAGSVDNVRLLDNYEVELISLASTTCYKAVNGLEPFQKKYENMNGLFNYTIGADHLVTRKNSGIESFNDLKGKKVAVGPAGSTTQAISQNIFDILGISTEVNAILMSFADMYDALRDRNVDAFFLSAGIPAPALQELARTTPIKIINFDQKLMDDLIKLGGGYIKGEIEAGTYYGVDEPITTLMDVTCYACRSDLPEDVAYSFVRAVFENLDEIKTISAGLEPLSLDMAINGIPLPVHAGALRYYREVGLVK